MQEIKKSKYGPRGTLGTYGEFIPRDDLDIAVAAFCDEVERRFSFNAVVSPSLPTIPPAKLAFPNTLFVDRGLPRWKSPYSGQSDEKVGGYLVGVVEKPKSNDDKHVHWVFFVVEDTRATSRDRPLFNRELNVGDVLGIPFSVTDVAKKLGNVLTNRWDPTFESFVHSRLVKE